MLILWKICNFFIRFALLKFNEKKIIFVWQVRQQYGDGKSCCIFSLLLFSLALVPPNPICHCIAVRCSIISTISFIHTRAGCVYGFVRVDVCVRVSALSTSHEYVFKQFACVCVHASSAISIKKYLPDIVFGV